MNKYYTPNISEFHMGFECEFKNKQQGNEWKREVCDQDTLNIAFHVFEENDVEDKFEDNFRVKYINSEDIEQLGWGDRGTLYETWNLRCPLGNAYYLQYGTSIDPAVKDQDTFFRITQHKSHTVFLGYIKNKSQLKALMKMLDML